MQAIQNRVGVDMRVYDKYLTKNNKRLKDEISAGTQI